MLLAGISLKMQSMWQKANRNGGLLGAQALSDVRTAQPRRQGNTKCQNDRRKLWQDNICSVLSFVLFLRSYDNSSNMDKILELNIKDFRAIKEADIALNGITVVTGINGCGKSTMSKFLYYALKYANDYEGLANQYLQRELRVYRRLFEIMEQEVYRFSDGKGMLEKFSHRAIILNKKEEFLLSLRELIEAVSDIYQKISERTETSLKRLMVILSSELKMEGENKDLSDLLSVLYESINAIFTTASVIVDERVNVILEEKLQSVFANDFSGVSLKEHGELLIGRKVIDTPVPYYVQKVVYIDTPVIIGTNGLWSACSYWDDLEILLQIEGQEVQKGITDIIKNEILHGDVALKEDMFDENDYIYTREDGKQFNLLDCATGIKSFSILQLLIKNGFIDKHTLVILDEPEAHLHPQWIVEYARMVVMIHKKIGTKFFIASHSTDMVSAIRYIAEKEKCLEPLSFYLAEEDAERPNQYIYRDLRTNIEPIFDSFNKSFDKIEQYGESKGYSTEEG